MPENTEKRSSRLEKALNLLEFDRIREAAASCALSAEAAKCIREEIPFFEPEKVRTRKKLVSSFCNLIKNAAGEKQQRFEEAQLPEIDFLLSHLAVDGSILETDEILALGLFLERGEELRRFILNGIPPPEKNGINPHSKDERDPADLRLLADSAPDCTSPAAEIFRIIDRDGTVRDLPEIKKIRRRIQDLTKELEQIGGRYGADENTRRMLQSALPSQRDGRLVLAVKANFRGRIKGIVHEVSATGQTIFVEPEESVEKNNQILIERANLEAEIRRLLKDLTAALAERRGELEEFHHIIVYIESLRARARYSLDISQTNREICFAAEPEFYDKSTGEFQDTSPALALKQARHPLLGNSQSAQNNNVVPIDLNLDSRTRMVIITGPNTGGKTVTIKTIGLFALMNQTGLALPAAEAILPIFDAVYADIGDEQSLTQSLSTFSAHMINIAEIIEEATDRSLVLLDELGAGTDPEEGSAIAMAILDHFIETKSTVVLTTHHGMLKNYGYSREGVENASVEFDRRTLSPTYRIIMGIPGESRAVDIAARNGFPPALVETARSYLDEERSDVSALISGLKEKHRELDQASRSAREEEKQLREDRRRTDLKELSLRQREHFLKREGAAEFRRFLAESRKSLENLVREIREGEISREKTAGAKNFISELETQSAAMEAVLEAEKEALAEMEIKTDLIRNAPKVAPGIEVLAGPSRRRGTVIRADTKKPAKKAGQNWIVEIGSVRISFSDRELLPASDALPHTVGWAAELSPAEETAETGSGCFASVNRSASAKLEINLLGMRMEEALEALRRQIDAAILAGLQEFSVVHGKGDGILQKGVQDYLHGDPAVMEYHFSRPELGGSGRTEVVLK
ncbi:MAG: endonuclease MutS2 [Treponema sp.]|nr:endonuclease MutS2 [Treponema sp.]